jgi:CheY-like chemotaxis protein
MSSENFHVLLVDDDEVIVRVLGRVLESAGYVVLRATTPPQALALAERTPPHVALLDLSYPHGNGVDLAKALRALYADLPMLLMTGRPFLLLERPDGAEYFRQVLRKPLELRELREAISAALKKVTHANHNAACPR